MAIDFARVRTLLGEFDFRRLFIEELGWNNPASARSEPFRVGDNAFQRRHVAQLSGVAVIEIESAGGTVPDAKTRLAVHREISKLHYENLLVFVDKARSQSVWYWVKREEGKLRPRDHSYFRGQPGDLFISKLSAMVFDLSELDESGNVPVVEVASRLRQALDVERVTKRFYKEYQDQHIKFLELIKGVPDERERRWYASVLLNRLMFVYFLQKKGFLDNGNTAYLLSKLDESKSAGRDLFFGTFLKALFFEGFAKPDTKRSKEAQRLIGSIPYLNGGLFLPHKVEQTCPKLDVPDRAFANLFDLFQRYSWNLNDTPGGDDNEINPDVLGYIFEKYINQKAFGAYYTRTEITEYLCEQTIHRLILNAVNTPGIPGMTKPRHFDSVAELLLNLDADLCRRLLLDALPGLSLLDPACGSGAFLIAAMKTLIAIYSAVIGKIKFLTDTTLTMWLRQREADHRSLAYYIKKCIITDNLFGVDIMEEACEIAKLRLFLSLVASAENVGQLEPLPNIDFNVMAGNSLIGLLRVDDAEFERRISGQLFRQRTYQQIVAEKNQAIEIYRHLAAYSDDLTARRDRIEQIKTAAREVLDDLLLAEFEHLGIKYEQATWNEVKKDEGRPVKRKLRIEDIHALKPFHWGYEFDEILNKRGGFDAIITNPPWEIFKPNSKEFFEDHSDLVTQKKMSIHDFEKVKAHLLKDQEIREAWLAYLSQFPHPSAFFRSASHYRNQISIVAGKRVGTDINLYKLFTEQCLNLLRQGGRCGIILQGSVYTDLGSTQLREALFSNTKVDALFGLTNERWIFEGVHHAQKFCLLAFEKGGKTEHFTAAFRINPREAVSPEALGFFLKSAPSHLRVPLALLRTISSAGLTVPEFRSEREMKIAETFAHFPSLGEQLVDTWNVQFTQEIHMTNDSHLFHSGPAPKRVPLIQGTMIDQFAIDYSRAKYWIDLQQGRRNLLGRTRDDGQLLSYQDYRLAHRRIASSTNERSLIAAVLPPNRFTADTAQSIRNILPRDITLLLTGLFNSFAVDFDLRRRITAHLDMHFMYATRIPRIATTHPMFSPIARRAAQLTCVSTEFDALANEVGLASHRNGATDTTERNRLRAELDGLIAHLYGLTEEEFAYILTTFPLVPEPVKVAAQNAYRDVERGLIK